MNGTDWLTEPIQQNALFIMIALLALILVAFVIIIVVLWRRGPRVMTVETSSLEQALARIKDESTHAVHVSAVLGLMEQLENNPDALQLIKSYPETVVAASWLHYINILGADLQKAQEHLSRTHRSGGGEYYIKPAQQHVDNLRAKLDAAVKASGQSGPRLQAL